VRALEAAPDDDDFFEPVHATASRAMPSTNEKRESFGGA